MKTLFASIAITLLALTCTHAAKKIEGYIIYDNRDSVQVTFLVPFGFLSPEPDYKRLQSKIRYLENDVKKTLRPEGVKEITFTHKGKKIRMLSVIDNLQLGSVFSTSTRVFLKLEIDGKVKLFNYFETRSTGGMYSPTTGMSTGGSYTVERYALQRDNGSLVRPRGLYFRKDMTEFLSDCPELVKKIEDRILRMGDLEVIVREYNSKCAD